MGPLPPVPGVIKITLKYDVGTDHNVLNRLFHSFTGGPATQTDIDAFASHVRSSFAANMVSVMNSNISLVETDAEDLSTTSGVLGVDLTAVPGTLSGAANPAATSVVISRQIARRFRGGHSRIYFPGATNNELTNPETWTSAYVAGVLADFIAFSTDIDTFTSSSLNAVEPVVVSYFLGHTNVLYPSGYYRAIPTARSSPLVSPVTSYRVNQSVGSQRRRNLYAPGA